MNTFNDFYNIYKSAVTDKDAYETYYNRQPAVSKRESSQTTFKIQQLKPVKDSRCVILIPVYKQHPDLFEENNLRNTFRKLSSFDVCLLCPESLNVSAYREMAGYEIQEFRKSDVFFRGKESYSRMIESPRFYKALQAWTFTLIVQPDVWIFGTANELSSFIDKDYVYLGGPWNADYCKTLGMEGEWCGNGGLSLRNNRQLAKFLESSENRNERLKTVEDQYISYILYKEGLASPAADGLPFAIDNDAENWHKKLGRLPWGIHMGNLDARFYWTEQFPNRFGAQDKMKPEIPEIAQEKKNYQLIASLTSFGDRLKNDAPIVIRNILERQTMKPDLIVLTVYKGDVSYIPKEIRDYERKRIVRIIVSDVNLRPHLKYYHTMLQYPDIPIITIDDDQRYAPELFKALYQKWKQHPDCVVANRCHLIRYSNGRPLPYKQWKMEYKKMTHPSDRLFATGVGGVLYPPGIFSEKDFDVDEIQKYITTDDIYLKVLEMRKRISTVCLDKYYAPAYINSKSAVSERLCDQNTSGLQINDKNIALGGLDMKDNYKKICYTVISGNYDQLIEPDVVTPGWQYILFTDQQNIKSNIWDIRPLPKEIIEDKELNQIKRQRIMKIQPYKFFDYDICLWVDGNMRIKCNLDEFCTGLPDVLFAVAAHPSRDCIYEEADAIVRYGKDKMKNMEEQMKLYREDGYPNHAGLCETNIMLRKHNPEVNKLMDMWADWLRKYSHRDQMSLNYCMWKLGFKYTRIPEDFRRKCFQWSGHRGYRK